MFMIVALACSVINGLLILACWLMAQAAHRTKLEVEKHKAHSQEKRSRLESTTSRRKQAVD